MNLKLACRENSVSGSTSDTVQYPIIYEVWLFSQNKNFSIGQIRKDFLATNFEKIKFTIYRPSGCVILASNLSIENQ